MARGRNVRVVSTTIKRNTPQADEILQWQVIELAFLSEFSKLEISERDHWRFWFLFFKINNLYSGKSVSLGDSLFPEYRKRMSATEPTVNYGWEKCMRICVTFLYFFVVTASAVLMLSPPYPGIFNIPGFMVVGTWIVLGATLWSIWSAPKEWK
jgi:hypothetical protein